MAVTLIRGRVLDENKRPLGGARIFITSAPVPMPDIAQLSDAQGAFSLGVPVPGTYRIGVAAQGHDRAERELTVTADSKNELEFQLRGKPS